MKMNFKIITGLILALGLITSPIAAEYVNVIFLNKNQKNLLNTELSLFNMAIRPGEVLIDSFDSKRTRYISVSISASEFNRRQNYIINSMRYNTQNHTKVFGQKHTRSIAENVNVIFIAKNQNNFLTIENTLFNMVIRPGEALIDSFDSSGTRYIYVNISTSKFNSRQNDIRSSIRYNTQQHTKVVGQKHTLSIMEPQNKISRDNTLQINTIEPNRNPLNPEIDYHSDANVKQLADWYLKFLEDCEDECKKK